MGGEAGSSWVGDAGERERVAPPPQLNGLEGRGQWGRGQQRCQSWGLGQCRPFSLHLPTSSMGLDLGAPCGVRSGGRPGSWSISLGLVSLLVDGALSSRALLYY